jgi:hypothetical protein
VSPSLSALPRYHDNSINDKSDNLAFTDGPVEAHRWREGTTVPPIPPGAHLSGVVIFTSTTDQDMKCLTEHATLRQ